MRTFNVYSHSNFHIYNPELKALLFKWENQMCVVFFSSSVRDSNSSNILKNCSLFRCSFYVKVFCRCHWVAIIVESSVVFATLTGNEVTDVRCWFGGSKNQISEVSAVDFPVMAVYCSLQRWTSFL